MRLVNEIILFVCSKRSSLRKQIKMSVFFIFEHIELENLKIKKKKTFVNIHGVNSLFLTLIKIIDEVESTNTVKAV